MRISANDNYGTIALIGNNSHDIKFMNYLFESQGVKSIYDISFEINDLDIDEILKRIAYHLGNSEPLLIDNNGLKKICLTPGVRHEFHWNKSDYLIL